METKLHPLAAITMFLFLIIGSLFIFLGFLFRMIKRLFLES